MVIELGPEPSSASDWVRAVWDHRQVTWILARKDFQTRYKRAALGVLWAILLPLLQAVVLIVIFSRIIDVESGISYGVYVLSGVLAWGYFSATVPAGVTSIVDNASLTDKLWFPRAVLPLVPAISGLFGLGLSMIVLLIATPILGAGLGLRTLLLIPACLLLIAFVVSASLLLSAVQVYFRDMKFIASAGLTVWLYVTPIMYPRDALGSAGQWLDANPLTGILALFHTASIGPHETLLRPLAVSVGATIAMLIAAIEVHRRHDRLFADLL